MGRKCETYVTASAPYQAAIVASVSTEAVRDVALRHSGQGAAGAVDEDCQRPPATATSFVQQPIGPQGAP